MSRICSRPSSDLYPERIGNSFTFLRGIRLKYASSSGLLEYHGSIISHNLNSTLETKSQRPKKEI